MRADLPASEDANIATTSDCIERSRGIGSWNVIPVNRGNEMCWRRDSVEGRVCWQDEGKGVKRCCGCGYPDRHDQYGVAG